MTKVIKKNKKGFSKYPFYARFQLLLNGGGKIFGLTLTNTVGLLAYHFKYDSSTA